MDEKIKFNVINWNFNTDTLEAYDVLPYLRNKCKGAKSLEELKSLIESKSKYQFWSRCQYEVIVHGWPVQKNDYKIDVYEQIMMNIDVIAKILWEENENSN